MNMPVAAAALAAHLPASAGSPIPPVSVLALPEPARIYTSPGSEHAQPLDLLSARFGLKTILTIGARFNLRRDINNVITLAGRHLVWTDGALSRLQAFMTRRCAEAASWQGIDRLSHEEFVARHGSWNGLYDDAAFYYYLDEYVKQHAKDLLGVFRTTVEALDARLSGVPVRLIDNVDLLARVLDLNATERTVLLHA